MVQHIRPLKVEELEELEGAVRVQMSLLLLQMEVVILVVGEELEESDLVEVNQFREVVLVVPESSSLPTQHKYLKT